MKYFAILFFIFISKHLILSKANKYQPDWSSLDTRHLPTWYDESKVGIFIHWGVFSVPAYGSEWFWWQWKSLNYSSLIYFMEQNYPPNFQYPEFAPLFKAEFFDPYYWARIFKRSGAKYVVLTSKHHEGFALWPAKTSWNWNSMDIGPKRDLVGELGQKVKEAGLHFGIYHSLFEWFNPLYLNDKSNNFKTNNFVKSKVIPEMKELILNYKPEVIWSDGEWEAEDIYWQSKEFLAWLYNESPVKDTVVVNDRWGRSVLCKHGDFLTCQDRFNPDKLMNKKWENAMTLDLKSWGYIRTSTSEDYITRIDLLETLARTVSYGGNLLINIGPTSDGIIPPIMEERLIELGEWLEVFGESIYSTKPWKHQNDSLTKKIWYTSSKDSLSVYCIFFKWPFDNKLMLGSIRGKENKTQITRIVKNLSYANYIPLKWTNNDDKVVINLDNSHLSLTAPWVLKITNPYTFDG